MTNDEKCTTDLMAAHAVLQMNLQIVESAIKHVREMGLAEPADWEGERNALRVAIVTMALTDEAAD